MTARSALILLVVLYVGCQVQDAHPSAKYSRETVFQLVISDLAQRESPDAMFVGSQVWVSPQFNKGDSLFYSWGNEIDVDDELVAAMKAASRETGDFPQPMSLGPDARVTEIESFHDLDYYGEGRESVDAKCLVQFWRPGYADDGKLAIVRFYYGPSPHGAAGTYVLRYTEGRWKITASTISYYL